MVIYSYNILINSIIDIWNNNRIIFFRNINIFKIPYCIIGSITKNTIIDKFNGGPVGISTIATAVGEDSGTIEEVYEPFLIKEGYIKRTQRGREVTERAYLHIGKKNTGRTGLLFK